MSKKEKIHISIDKELIPKLENECKETDRTRSALINFILNKFFKDRDK
jgi:metal-responsive CopG/Arc/MetJ family transcriptional regulator